VWSGEIYFCFPSVVWGNISVSPLWSGETDLSVSPVWSGEIDLCFPSVVWKNRSLFFPEWSGEIDLCFSSVVWEKKYADTYLHPYE